MVESDLLTDGKPELGKGKPCKIILYLEKRSRKDWIKTKGKTIRKLYPVAPQRALDEIPVSGEVCH